MPERGGTSTQAGILFQNSVAAHAMADMLDFDPRSPRERIIEIRVEAPEPVDDLVIRFADEHRDFCSIKLDLAVNDAAWKKLWQSFAEQCSRKNFGPDDHVDLIVCNRSTDSDATLELCERARTSVDETELRARLSKSQSAALDSIETAIGGSADVLPLLRSVRVRHRSIEDLEDDIRRRELAGSMRPGVALFAILRDMVGGEARRRGFFRAAPLRRRLKLERDILLPEPKEWGLGAYREMLTRLAQIAVPGTARVGPVSDLFVWTRARDYDASGGQSDFEDELVLLGRTEREPTVDLSAFPSQDLHQVVVVAGPGHGKSAMLTAITGALAPGPLIPVTVPLASLAESGLSVINFLAQEVNAELDVGADWRLLAEQGLLVLLFDGLDEVPAAARAPLLKRIAQYSARNPRSPWMLTVRDPAVVSNLPMARMVELLPLNDDDMCRFVETISGKPHRDSWNLVQQLALRPDLYRLARIPLFLVILLVTTDLDDPTPLTRADVIEAYLKTIFSPADHKETSDPNDRSDALRAIASILAFERLERQEIGATDREVRDVIARHVTAPEDRQILFDRLIANGILKRQSSIRLQFSYPIVQEYLAASFLIETQPETLARRIDDAIQRPWAQVIQFALELHPEPEPLILAMLERGDDAFRTGLRLVGRCIANGARVSDATRERVAAGLVDYWISAPYRSRERVGRLLADGFISPAHAPLRQALHHRWLINDGAGEILSRLGELGLTLSVLASLMQTDANTIMIYHSLKPALAQAGDQAIAAVAAEIERRRGEPEYVVKLASLFDNFVPGSVSREPLLAIGEDNGLPLPTRLSAFVLAGPPVGTVALRLLRESFAGDDRSSHYDAAKLLRLIDDPTPLVGGLLIDPAIPNATREYIAGALKDAFPNLESRRAFARKLLEGNEIDDNVRYTLMLFEARYGDRAIFQELIDQLDTLPLRIAGTTIALFGHYRDVGLSAAAVAKVRERQTTGADAASLAGQASTGLRYVFEMDFGFGGIMREAPAHPGAGDWLGLLEDWLDRDDLQSIDRMEIATAASEFGSELANAVLRDMLLGIEDFDDPQWLRDEHGHKLTRSLRQLESSDPILPLDFIERLLAASQYNIATHGLTALLARSDREALDRLIDYHPTAPDWMLRDMASDKIEIIASRLGLTITGDRRGYRIAGD